MESIGWFVAGMVFGGAIGVAALAMLMGGRDD